MAKKRCTLYTVGQQTTTIEQYEKTNNNNNAATHAECPLEWATSSKSWEILKIFQIVILLLLMYLIYAKGPYFCIACVVVMTTKDLY